MHPRALLEAGSDPNKAEEDGWTALMFAAKNGHDLCARALLEAGAAIDAVQQDGATSLLCASQNGHEACVNLLIELGAGVNLAMNADALDGEGSFTALVSACINEQEECTIRLLAAGANAESQSTSGDSKTKESSAFACRTIAVNTVVMNVLCGVGCCKM